jgi:hypothetical protein
MPKITIDQLSLAELQVLCYNNFNTQVHHPCFCAACGKGYKEAQEFEKTHINPSSLKYCCDDCVKALSKK